MSRFTHASYCFYFLMINLTVDQGIFSELEIFLYPFSNLCFSVTYLWSCLKCILSFVFYPDIDAPVTELKVQVYLYHYPGNTFTADLLKPTSCTTDDSCELL